MNIGDIYWVAPEQSQALGSSSEEPLTFVDPATNRKYVLVAADDFSKLETVAAIRTGLSQMETSEGLKLGVAFKYIRNQIERRDS